MALHVMDEANHCLGCKVPRCQQGCPIHTNIPEVIRLLKANKLDEAGRMLFENNPLTTVCSLVCNHENQCEGHCVRGIKGAPVHFSVIENYISSTYASQMTQGPAPSNGKKAAIIGSGPAGLSAAIYAKRAKLSSLTIEANFASGGQVLNTYEVDNYPGLPGISGMDLGSTLRAHAEKMGAEFSRERVKELVLDEEIKIVRTRKNEYHAKTVILATGAEHRALNVPGEKELSGMGVSYCATCDGAFFKDKTVAVIGGGDVAVEDAIFLARTCKKVYVIHRRDELRAAGVLQDALLALPNVEMVWDTVVDSIEGNEMVSGVKVTNKKAGEAGVITVDGVFIAVGIVPVSALIAGIVETDEAGYIKAGEDGVTSVPGVFAAGDVRTKQLRQIITAAADGANCVTSVEKYLISH